MNKLLEVLAAVVLCLAVGTTHACAQPKPIKPVGKRPSSLKSSSSTTPKSTVSKLTEEQMFKMFKELARDVERATEAKRVDTLAKKRDVRDPAILSLYDDFLRELGKIGLEHEQNDDYEKAMEAYSAMLQVMPGHRGATMGIGRIFKDVATKDEKTVQVAANKAWQNTGIVLVKGNPVTINASGTWTFTFSEQLSPEGINLPKELRKFNMGSLIGVISSNPKDQDVSDVFHVGASKSFVASKTGYLFLRMYDSDPRDNKGELNVQVRSTFGN